MPRTVFILQTTHEPSVDEIRAMANALFRETKIQGPDPLSCTVVSPNNAPSGIGSRIAEFQV